MIRAPLKKRLPYGRGSVSRLAFSCLSAGHSDSVTVAALLHAGSELFQVKRCAHDCPQLLK